MSNSSEFLSTNATLSIPLPVQTAKNLSTFGLSLTISAKPRMATLQRGTTLHLPIKSKNTTKKNSSTGNEPL